LLILVITWAAGRVAVTLSAETGWLAAALIDSGFLVLIVAAAAREIIAGRNWGNLKVLIPVTILGLGNAAFHVEAHVLGVADYGIRIGVAAILVLIMIIGGRLIPSFTRNWLARENPGRLPIPYGRFDAHRAIGAKHATITRLRPQHHVATRAPIKELASIARHRPDLTVAQCGHVMMDSMIISRIITAPR
jgi:uncharacterized protein involved in response to NO